MPKDLRQKSSDARQKYQVQRGIILNLKERINNTFHCSIGDDDARVFLLLYQCTLAIKSTKRQCHEEALRKRYYALE